MGTRANSVQVVPAQTNGARRRDGRTVARHCIDQWQESDLFAPRRESPGIDWAACNVRVSRSHETKGVAPLSDAGHGEISLTLDDHERVIGRSKGEKR